MSIFFHIFFGGGRGGATANTENSRDPTSDLDGKSATMIMISTAKSVSDSANPSNLNRSK